MRQRPQLLWLGLAVAAAAALAATPVARPAGPQLIGTAGPGFDLSLADAAGTLATRLEPGTYAIEVRDLSSEHNFHLYGPGLDRTTDLSGRSTETWTVTLVTGRYRAVCDPHSSSMVQDIVVGEPGPGEFPPLPSSTAKAVLLPVAATTAGKPAPAPAAAAARAAQAKAVAARAAAAEVAAAKRAAAAKAARK